MPETNCVVLKCSKNVSKDEICSDAWIHTTVVEMRSDKWTPFSHYSYLCGDHFTEEDYVTVNMQIGLIFKKMSLTLLAKLKKI